MVATHPTDADRRILASLSERDHKTVGQIAFVVKLRFASIPEPTSMGWALYVGGEQVPKYWGYQHGIYFKVYERQYFAQHHGDPIRFSHDRQTFIDTGHQLEDISRSTGRRGASGTMTLEQALDD